MKMSLNKVLSRAAIIIFALILFLSLILFATGKANPGVGTRKADPEPKSIEKDMAAFTELGQIRSLSKAEENNKGVPLVVSPWLSYKAGDKTFYEELVQKNRKIKTLITEYFSQYTQQELFSLGEDRIKADLLHQINAELVLGKISAVYFSEYIFL